MAGLLDFITESAKKQYAKGAPYREAVTGLFQGDTSGFKKLNAPTPVNQNEALDVAMTFAPLGITAFHGTPHEIAGGKFDLSKIGTGLGAQSFGHGLYFSKSPKFAETFTGRTVIQEPKLDKFTFNGPDYTISNGEYLKNNKPISESEYKDAFKGINNLWNTQNKGNLYKIDIADETIPKMLNWDKPLSEQSPDVLNALEKKFSLESFGKDYATAGDFYKSRRNKFNSNEKASEELKNLGITGINYLDPGSRGTSETLNYVVFDPNTVKILERNGLLLP